MDDQLRCFPMVLGSLGRSYLVSPEKPLHEDGVVMLREHLVRAFVEVSTMWISMFDFRTYALYERMVDFWT